MKVKQLELATEIQTCKMQYRDKIKDMFTSKDIRKAWQGIKKASGYHQETPKIEVQIQNNSLKI